MWVSFRIRVLDEVPYLKNQFLPMSPLFQKILHIKIDGKLQNLDAVNDENNENLRSLSRITIHNGHLKFGLVEPDFILCCCFLDC